MAGHGDHQLGNERGGVGSDDASAQGWATQLEDDCAAGYRALLASVATGSTALRQQALTGLSSAAKQAGYWRGLQTPDAPTVPFPGS